MDDASKKNYFAYRIKSAVMANDMNELHVTMQNMESENIKLEDLDLGGSNTLIIVRNRLKASGWKNETNNRN